MITVSSVPAMARVVAVIPVTCLFVALTVGAVTWVVVTLKPSGSGLCVAGSVACVAVTPMVELNFGACDARAGVAASGVVLMGRAHP